MTIARFKTLFALGLLAAIASMSPASATPLPPLNIDIKETSVSGISSGGFMAGQFQVAFSSVVKGAGIVAAGPYGCAQGDAINATMNCSCTLDPDNKICSVSPSSTHPSALEAAAREAEKKGLIDDLSNVARQRVVTFAGGHDPIVPPPVVAQLGQFLAGLGVPAGSLNAVVTPEAGHTMPTLSYGAPCSQSREPFIGRCNVDAAGKIFEWIYGPMSAPTKGPAKGKLVQFDQKQYFAGGTATTDWWGSGLDDTGWIFIPKSCSTGSRCRLHVALHGCMQGQHFLPLHPVKAGQLYYGTTFVKNAGYLRWADANSIVVLFPQAVSIPVKNPSGCWDWWGYTGAHYADKQGIQMATLRAMVEALTTGAR